MKTNRRYTGWPAVVGILLVLALNTQGCSPAQDISTPVAPLTMGPSTTTALSTTLVPTASIGLRTKTSGCISVNGLSDQACTPGAILPQATREMVCVSGYSSQVRNVPDSEKKQVYAEYGIVSHSPGQFEVDHLISLELGGSNEIANLWPEPADPRPGFHEKDKVENYLHDQVCIGAISLQQAQIEVANNWLLVYQGMPNK